MTEDPSASPPPLPDYRPPSPQPATQPDAADRQRARKRLQARREFRTHLAVYWLVMTLLVLIWLLTGGWGSYFWPVWPMLGWGLGVAIHGATLVTDREPTEEEIDAEAARIRARRTQARIED